MRKKIAKLVNSYIATNSNMTNRKLDEVINVKKTNKNTRTGMALGMCLGVSIGTAIGSTFDNMAMGTSIC